MNFFKKFQEINLRRNKFTENIVFKKIFNAVLDKNFKSTNLISNFSNYTNFHQKNSNLFSNSG